MRVEAKFDTKDNCRTTLEVFGDGRVTLSDLKSLLLFRRIHDKRNPKAPTIVLLDPGIIPLSLAAEFAKHLTES